MYRVIINFCYIHFFFFIWHKYRSPCTWYKGVNTIMLPQVYQQVAYIVTFYVPALLVNYGELKNKGLRAIIIMYIIIVQRGNGMMNNCDDDVAATKHKIIRWHLYPIARYFFLLWSSPLTPPSSYYYRFRQISLIIQYTTPYQQFTWFSSEFHFFLFVFFFLIIYSVFYNIYVN